MYNTINSILIVGPTGSGKTPFGDYLEKHGLADRSCFHFDFGFNLRSAAQGILPGFTKEEIIFIQNVLNEGMLLENETFYLAKKILMSFLDSRSYTPPGILLLNGLPRHVGQAEAMSGFVSVRAVVSLSCTSETVYERIHLDSGGDRAERDDDQFQLVKQKLEIFTDRTVPLIDYYRNAGAEIIALEVKTRTKPAELASALLSRLDTACL